MYAVFPRFQLGLGVSGSTTNAINAGIDGIIGPCAVGSVTGGNQNIGFANQTVVADASIVMAGIFRVNSVAALQFIAGQGGNSICLQISAAGAIQAGIAFGTLVSSGVTAVTGTPYFFAASIKTGLWALVVRNLITGKINTATAATAITMPTPSGTVQIFTAATNGSSFNGRVATFMFSNGWASVTELAAWAQDPWKFWYPNKDQVTFAGFSDVLRPQIWM